MHRRPRGKAGRDKWGKGALKSAKGRGKAGQGKSAKGVLKSAKRGGNTTGVGKSGRAPPMKTTKLVYENTSKAMTPELRALRISMLPKDIIPANLGARMSYQVPVSMGKIEVNLARAHYYVWSAPEKEKIVSWADDSGQTAKEAWKEALRKHQVALKKASAEQPE